MAQAWLGLADRYQGVEKISPLSSSNSRRSPNRSAWLARVGQRQIHEMPSHKFHIGETVTLIPSISRNVAGGIYQVVRQLPHNGLYLEYHIKSANEPIPISN